MIDRCPPGDWPHTHEQSTDGSSAHELIGRPGPGCASAGCAGGREDREPSVPEVVVEGAFVRDRRAILRLGAGGVAAAIVSGAAGTTFATALSTARARRADATTSTADTVDTAALFDTMPEADYRAAAVQVPAPPIITRAEWGADESLRQGTRRFAPIRKCVIHHTVTANDAPDQAAVVRSVYAFHTEGRDFDDVAYNFLIDPAGRVYEGRWARDYAPGEIHSGEDTVGRGVVGAHTLDYNTGTMGVALLGNYVSVSPTDAALASLVQLLAWKMSSRELDPLASDTFTNVAGTTSTFPNICGHRDLGNTACPGGVTYALLPDLRSRVALRLRGGLLGYRILTSDGDVAAFGAAAATPTNPKQVGLRGPFVSIAPVPSRVGTGYWVLGADGGIYAFGDAQFYGSVPGVGVRTRVADLAPTPTGRGYWVLGVDGGIYAFGDAQFYGSVPGVGVRTFTLKLRPTPSGGGYWVLGVDGGIYAFGDAQFYGSVPGVGVRTSVVDLAPTSTGRGYRVLGADGGVFAFGDATFHGSLPGIQVAFSRPLRAIVATPSGAGYLVLANDGGVFTFGDCPFHGSTGGTSKTVVGIAPLLA